MVRTRAQVRQGVKEPEMTIVKVELEDEQQLSYDSDYEPEPERPDPFDYEDYGDEVSVNQPIEPYVPAHNI